MKSLQDKVTFYIVTETLNGQDLAVTLAQEGAQKYGGATMTPGVGLWAAGGDRATESVSLLTIFADRKDRADWARYVAATAERIGQELGQEAVFVEVNGIGGLYERNVDYY